VGQSPRARDGTVAQAQPAGLMNNGTEMNFALHRVL